MSRIVTVKMPEKYIELLDVLVRMGLYSSKSEAIRTAVRDLLVKHGFFANPKNRHSVRRVRI